MNETRHEELRSLLPDYLLDQIPREAREELERHLRGCPSCQEEAEALGEVLAWLGQGVPQVAPPPRLWERLRREVEAAHSRRRAAAWPVLAVAGVLLGLVGVVVGALGWLRGQARTAQLEQRLVAMESSLQEARRQVQWLMRVAHAQMAGMYMAVTGEARPLMVRAAEPTSRTRGVLVVHPEGRMAVLMVEGLDGPGPGRAYQVWLVRETEQENGGLFRPSEAGWAELLIRPSRSIWEYHRIGVTEEPEGGSPGPTGPPVLLIPLR